MIQRLPNGVLPNPTFRSKVYQLILTLPILSEYLTRTSVGKTLTIIEKSGDEIDSNLRLIREIKEKWSRLLCKSKSEFKNEDNEEGKVQKRKVSKPYIPHHVRDSGKITTNYQDVEASQVRRMKRRYDFVFAPPSNVEIERHEKVKVD